MPMSNISTASNPELAWLSVSGIDAKRFLQGQLTCNMNEITECTEKFAAHCNPQGRIISFFRIYLLDEKYFLILPKDMVEIALNALKKYALFFKVILSTGCQLEACWHDTANSKPKRHDTANAKPESHDKAHSKPECHASMLLAGIQENKTHIHSGIPQIYAKTSGMFLPHEVNLQLINAISFDKGCYTGQEIIARMQYRGQLKKHMYLAFIKTNSLPSPGDEIFCENKIAGNIVDATHSSEGIEILFVANKNDVATKTFYLNENSNPLKILSLPYSVS